MKNILLIAHNPLLRSKHYCPRGGAISMKEICKHLSEKCNLFILQFDDFNEIKKIDDITYITEKTSTTIMKTIASERIVKDYNINLILTWGHESKIACYLKKEHGIEYIIFVQRFQVIINGYLNLMDKFEKLIGKKNSPYNQSYPDRIKKYIRSFITFFHDNFVYSCNIETAFKEALLICSNSKYTSKCIKKILDRDSFLIYPAIEPNKYIFNKEIKSQPSKEFISFMSVNLTSKEKKLFNSLAAMFPKENFLLVGTKYRTNLKNVYFQEKFTEDVRELYAKTKIILRPRIIPEPFGRTPLEASVTGIPSIITDLGGHSEAMGKGGILIPPNSDLRVWENFLKSMLYDYNLYSEKAKEHFEYFYNEYTIKQMDELIKLIIDKNEN